MEPDTDPNDEIKNRLLKIKDPEFKLTDEDIRRRLDALKEKNNGTVPVSEASCVKKDLLLTPQKTETQQVEELMSQYVNKSNIESTMHSDTEVSVKEIEDRLNKIKEFNRSMSEMEVKGKSAVKKHAHSALPGQTVEQVLQSLQLSQLESSDDEEMEDSDLEEADSDMSDSSEEELSD